MALDDKDLEQIEQMIANSVEAAMHAVLRPGMAVLDVPDDLVWMAGENGYFSATTKRQYVKDGRGGLLEMARR